MREAEEAARLDIATDSLKHFIRQRGEPVTRNEFFVTTSPEGSALHDKALRSRTWQKTFMQRLTDYNFLKQVKQGDTIKYEIYSDAANTFLLLSTVDRDYYHGVLISNLVFGGLSQEGFIKLCVKRFSEMKTEGFESIDNEKHKQMMLNGFPDFTQLVSDESENPQIMLVLVEEKVREVYEDEDENRVLVKPRSRLADRIRAAYEKSTRPVLPEQLQPDETDQPPQPAQSVRPESLPTSPPPLSSNENGAPETPLWSKGLASTVMKQASVLLAIEALLRDLVEQEVPAIVENIQATRTGLRDSKKDSDELVKSLQGLLKQHAGLSQIDIPAKLAELEACAKASATALDALSENVKAITNAVSDLTNKQEKMFEHLFEHISASHDDKLGQAARDLEAVHALITEVLAKRKS